jgi:hypothetical protein
MRLRRELLLIATAASVGAFLLLTRAACARPHVRKHFEPTDLELEDPGTVELDLETGFMRSQDPWRFIAPDFELDLGLTEWLELDLDGAYALEGAPGKKFSFDHEAIDPLWPSLKAGLVDIVDKRMARTYALGAQLGPKLPTFSGGRGVGVEGLLLAGVDFGLDQFAVNLGGFLDPAPEPGAARPIAVEAGIDWERDLDSAGRYSLAGEVSGVVFFSDDAAQLQATFGGGYAATSWLDLSLTGLVGFLPGSDRYGFLFGFAPHVPLWKPAPDAPDDDAN